MTLVRLCIMHVMIPCFVFRALGFKFSIAFRSIYQFIISWVEGSRYIDRRRCLSSCISTTLDKAKTTLCIHHEAALTIIDVMVMSKTYNRTPWKVRMKKLKRKEKGVSHKSHGKKNISKRPLHENSRPHEQLHQRHSQQ